MKMIDEYYDHDKDIGPYVKSHGWWTAIGDTFLYVMIGSLWLGLIGIIGSVFVLALVLGYRFFSDMLYVPFMIMALFGIMVVFVKRKNDFVKRKNDEELRLHHLVKSDEQTTEEEQDFTWLV